MGTSDNVITTLKVAIHKAMDWDYIEKSPFPRRLSWLRQKKPRVKEPLTLEEVRRFLQYTPEELTPLYLFAIFSGLRQGEILAAKWKNLDWEEGKDCSQESCHTVFGYVISGMEHVNAMSEVPTDANNVPVEPVRLLMAHLTA